MAAWPHTPLTSRLSRAAMAAVLVLGMLVLIPARPADAAGTVYLEFDVANTSVTEGDQDIDITVTARAASGSTLGTAVSATVSELAGSIATAGGGNGRSA